MTNATSANYEDQLRHSVFIDETALAALMNPAHPYYIKARSLFLDLDDLDRDFITTNYIVFDTHEWLRNEFGYAQADFFLNTIEKASNGDRLAVIPSSEELEMESRRLLLERPELQYSLSEALTAVIMFKFRLKRIMTFNPRHAALRKLNKDIKLIPGSC